MFEWNIALLWDSMLQYRGKFYFIQAISFVVISEKYFQNVNCCDNNVKVKKLFLNFLMKKSCAITLFSKTIIGKCQKLWSKFVTAFWHMMSCSVADIIIDTLVEISASFFRVPWILFWNDCVLFMTIQGALHIMKKHNLHIHYLNNLNYHTEFSY